MELIIVGNTRNGVGTVQDEEQGMKKIFHSITLLMTFSKRDSVFKLRDYIFFFS